MKKLLAVLTSILLLCGMIPLGAIPVSAATSGKTGDCTWTLEDTHLTISGNGAMGASTPWGSSITKVTIGDGVTSIPANVFKNCSSLLGVYITDVAAWCAIDFGDYSSNPLYYAKRLYVNNVLVTNLVIPNDVTTIGNYAFQNGIFLSSVTIPDSVTTIGTDAFNGCNDLSAVYITDIAAWCMMDFGNHKANPLYNAEELFLNGDLVTDLVVPDNVTNISENAFINCYSLTSVTIPDSVTTIGKQAFYNCNHLNAVTIPNSVTEIGDEAFYNSSNLTSVVIPDSVTSLGTRAFSSCHNLTSVVISNGITEIGYGVFSFCSDLKAVTIPDNVTDIGEQAFYYCNKLNSVTLPLGILTIGTSAFAECSSLAYVYYEGNTTQRYAISISSSNSPLTSATWNYKKCIHRYDGVCGVVCNKCGQERTNVHAYDSLCDPECNLCGEQRAAHVYDNVCDANCNVCGVVRAVDGHTYDNACDVDCNACGVVREVGEHVYADACDTDCNACGLERVAPHAYIDVCDTECDACGLRRIAPHVYADIFALVCSECGLDRLKTLYRYREKTYTTATEKLGHPWVLYNTTIRYTHDSYTYIYAEGDSYSEAYDWKIANQNKYCFHGGLQEVYKYMRKTSPFDYIYTTNSNNVDLSKYSYVGTCWRIEACRQIIETEVYHYYQWSAWSAWSETPVAAGDDVEVETKILYSVSFNANGGVGAPDVAEQEADTALVISTTVPTNSNKQFLGWSTTPDGAVEYLPGDTYEGYADMTLYAVWFCDHTYSSDCDADCNLCGDTREVEPHSYIGTITTPANCGNAGVMTYTCPVCGDTYTESMPPIGDHVYDNDADPDCNVCGHLRQAAHIYVGTVITPNSCVRDGVTTYTCSICGDTYTETLPATGKHVYDNGFDTDCDVCGYVREVEVPADAPTFVMEDATVRVGDTFTVAIRTQNNSGIVSLKLQVSYDTDLLELVSVAEGDFSGLTFGPLANTPFIVNWVDALRPNNTTNGNVVLLSFRVKDTATVGKTAIAISYNPNDVYDYDFNNVAFLVENSTVNIVDSFPGDVNGDLEVNNKDLGLLQRYLNEWEVSVDTFAADTDGNGRINNQDLGLLQRYLNGWDIELG